MTDSDRDRVFVLAKNGVASNIAYTSMEEAEKDYRYDTPPGERAVFSEIKPIFVREEAAEAP